MGAPKGPRLPIEQRTDAQGSFVVFTGKTCTVCALALTSRNRHGTRRLCLTHGREMDVARHRPERIRVPCLNRIRTMPTTLKPAREPAQDLRCDFQTPQYRQVQRLFTQFMNYPTTDGYSALLVSAMNEYELMARLRQVIPG